MSTAFLAAEAHRELPMPAWAFAAIALVLFALLLGFLWSFRNTAAKYDPANAHLSDPQRHLGDGHGHGAVEGRTVETHRVESGEVYRAGAHGEGRHR